MKHIIIICLIGVSRICNSYTLTKATCGVEIYDPTTTGCCDGLQYDFLTHYCCANNDAAQSMTLTTTPCNNKPSSSIASGLSSSANMNFDAGTILVIRSADDSVAESGLSAAALSETDDVAHEIDEFFGLSNNDDENETDDDNDGDDDGEDDDDMQTTSSFETTDDSASLDDMDTTDATGSGSGSNDDDSDSDSADSGEVDGDFDSEFNEDGTLSDRSGAILGGANGANAELDANASNSSESMDYYVKITLINMWLILALIVVINIVFYWCYCRRQARHNKATVDFDDEEGPVIVVNHHLSEEEQQMIGQ